MLFAEAHSFAQQARLALTLSWVAGYTNVVSILVCGTAASHVTGLATSASREVIEGRWTVAIGAIGLILCFLAGAVASAIMTELGRRRAWESIYVMPILTEMMLLASFSLLLELLGHDFTQPGLLHAAATGIAAFAMGIQNATITRISHGVVRTTHLTGIVTDLGLEGVQFAWWTWDRRHRVSELPRGALLHRLYHHSSLRRLALLASIGATFVLGAMLGTASFVSIPEWSMIPPVLFLAFVIIQDIQRPIAELAELPIGGEIETEEGEVAVVPIPPEIAIWHIRDAAAPHGGGAGRARLGADPQRMRRLPGLRNWLRDLAPEKRLLLIDLTGSDRLDSDTLGELARACGKLHAEGRRLMLCGVGDEQRARFARALGEVLSPDGLWPDLETALAYAILNSSGEFAALSFEDATTPVG
jgi:uncharacterized membrane protein YoaK (UPF0700 family)